MNVGSKPVLLIIGNGMASYRLCHSLVRMGPLPFEIIIFGEEPFPAYDRANLTKYFDLNSSSPPLLADTSWYAKNGIKLLSGTQVDQIDTKSKTVTLSSRGVQKYDKLVIATGSLPNHPKIEGLSLPGVFTYRQWDDLVAIAKKCQTPRRVVVLGGGLLGLEAVDALLKFSCDITLVENANTLLCRQLNEEGGEYLVRELATQGVRVLLKTHTTQISEYQDSLTVSLSDGSQLSADLVLLATGVKPNDILAREAGLNVSARGGILVNDNLETSEKRIYAIGDCASHHGKSYGFLGAAYEQADCLAASFRGEERNYQGSDNAFRIQVIGIPVSVYGDYLGDGEHLTFRGARFYRMLVVSRGRIIGATSIGPWDQAGSLELAVKEKLRISRQQQRYFLETGSLQMLEEVDHVKNWPAHAIVCSCTKTSLKQLKACLIEGATSPNELMNLTGAGSVCGSCKPLLAGLTNSSDAEKQDAFNEPERVGTLTKASILGLILGVIFLFPGGFPEPETIQSSYYSFSSIWRNDTMKQVTGYTTASLSFLSLIFSARKRIQCFQWGGYQFWRAAHTILGVSTLLSLFFHTGFHTGANLNFMLACSFILLNILGAIAAITIASDSKSPTPKSRAMRSLLTRLHFVFFWPYPVLLGFHIAKVYQY